MLNKCTFIGRLGQDGELKTLPNGTSIYENSLAVSEKWKDKEGKAQEKTEWINFKIFAKGGEIFNKYTEKGNQVYLEGSWQTRSWEKDGKKFYATDLNVKDFRFLDAKGGAEKTTIDSKFTADDIPF